MELGRDWQQPACDLGVKFDSGCDCHPCKLPNGLSVVVSDQELSENRLEDGAHRFLRGVDQVNEVEVAEEPAGQWGTPGC